MKLKKTKIGLIPKDWEVKRLGEVFNFLKTYSFSRKNLDEYSEINYIHYGDIHKKYKFHLDLDKEELPKISDILFKGEIEYLKNGDLIVADASEDYKGIAENIEIKNINNKKVVSGLHTFALRDKNNFFMNEYKGYILYNQDVKRKIKRIATGISVLGISKKEFSKILIPLPPLKEQEKIAKIISTWDRAIEKQEELIKAKERLKKGLMQKLLTGKVRFKGFSEEWKEVRLGEITKIYDGTHQTPKYTKKGIPFYSVENITSNNFGNTKYISEEVFEKEKKRVTIEKGDILLTRIGDIGTSKYVNWEVKASFYVSLALIKHSKNFNSLYLKYFFDSVFFQKELYRRTLHIAFPKKINLNEISKCKVILPPLAEQQKIAKVLSIADREIELLKEELEQLKKQKKGLMQRLLSGEVRVKV